MDDVFLLLCLVSIAAMVGGLINPGQVIRWGEKRTRPRVMLIYGISTILFFVLFGVTVRPTAPSASTQSPTSPTTTTGAQTAEANAKAKQDAEAKQKQYQQLVQGFEKALNDLDSRDKVAVDNFQKILKSNNIYSAYNAAKDAKSTMQNLMLAANNINIPKELPAEVQKLLEESKQDIGVAYYSKGTAFDYAMKFFDDKKPSNMQRFQDEMDAGTTFIISSVGKLVEAKSKVGL